MITTGQLDLGAAQIVDHETGELIGYVYTVANGHGQLQRWLLYKDPQNSFDVRPPSVTMSRWTIEDWQANVPSLWRSGSFYVLAQADVYHHGESYGGVDWTQIPPAAKLPQPTYPDGPGCPLQLDPTGGKALSVKQTVCTGLAYTVGGLRDTSNVEYWSLPSAYKPAGMSGGAEITTGTEDAVSLQGFIDVANRSWAAGGVFVITGCVNYVGDRAPAWL